MSAWIHIGGVGHGEWWYIQGSLKYFIDHDYTVRKWYEAGVKGFELVAGPFDSLDAAKAAMELMISS